MSELAWTAAAAACGAGTALLFFTGLYVPVRRLPGAVHPALLALASFAVRMGSAVFVLYLFARSGDWIRILACLAGFVIVRTVVVRKLGRGGGFAEGSAREHNA